MSSIMIGVNRKGNPYILELNKALEILTSLNITALKPGEKQLHFGFLKEKWSIFTVTVSDTGFILFSRILDASETQQCVIDFTFSIPDSHSHLLLDLKDMLS